VLEQLGECGVLSDDRLRLQISFHRAVRENPKIGGMRLIDM